MNSDQLKFTQNVKEKYNIDVLDIQKYTHRTIILNGSNGAYLLKFTNSDVEQKYEFLSSLPQVNQISNQQVTYKAHTFAY